MRSNQPDSPSPAGQSSSSATVLDQLFHRGENANGRQGLTWERFFSRGNVSPFDEIQWEKRTAAIIDAKGKIVFEQKDVEVPNFWTQNATNIVASKYFYGDKDKGSREDSIRQLIDRVTATITDWGRADGYFASENDAKAFYDELTWLIVHQYLTFNSPVWFNCGVHRYDRGSGAGRWYWNKATGIVELAEDDYTHPQCSACFILSVRDSMDSILTLAKTEGMIFKFGSGAGSNLSPLRSSREHLSGGGTASGPVSFMKGFDAFAGVIKSGGKTRRAA
jgi:ribonucleoside-diphosphate reductase alpha chain